MLDKILNITPGSDYKNSHLKKGQGGFYLPRSAGSPEFHDTLCFSPAWLFISQLNWQISGIKMLKEEKLSLDFLINDVEFHTVIDLNDLSSSTAFIYELSQKKAYNSVEKRTILTLEKRNCSMIPVNKVYDCRYINRLLERVWNLNINSELNDEEFFLNTLLEESYEEIDAEINFITVSLVTFIEKLLNKIFSHAFLKGENQTNKLKIKKIKSFNA